MSNQRYTPEFKDEAARQIVDRGYSVADVSKRLGVSAHSPFKCVKAVKPGKTEEQAAELIEARGEALKLRAQLKRIKGEREIQKRLQGILLKKPSKVPVCQRSSQSVQNNDALSSAQRFAQRHLSVAE